jgi:hypothetical protein
MKTPREGRIGDQGMRPQCACSLLVGGRLGFTEVIEEDESHQNPT